MLWNWAIQLRALVVLFASIHTSVQRSPEHAGPSNCATCQTAIQVSGPCDSTESLRNVNIVLAMPQLQQIESCAAPCRVETSDLQELFVGHPSSNSTATGSFDLFATKSRSNRSSKHSHVITRQVHIRTHRCTAWQTARFQQPELL